MSEAKRPYFVFLGPKHNAKASIQRVELRDASYRINYMASRMRAALHVWCQKRSADQATFSWWWDGLTYELTSAMSVVGHAAAFGVFVEIPALLRSLSDCMDGTHGPFFEVSPELRADIQRPLDPLDPTERVEEYYGDWWNHPGVPHELLDIDRAWDSYCEQYGAPTYHPRPLKVPNLPHPAPAMTKATPEDPCTSKVCRSRLYCINEYVKSLHTHLRTLWSDLVAAGVKTDRDIQHMTFLQKFQKGRQGSVSDGDIEKIMAGTDSDTFFNLQDEDGSEAGNLADKEGSESLKAESVSSNNLSSDESM